MHIILNNILEKQLLEKEVFKKEVLEKKKSAKINYWYNAFVNIHNLICELFIEKNKIAIENMSYGYEIINVLQN